MIVSDPFTHLLEFDSPQHLAPFLHSLIKSSLQYLKVQSRRIFLPSKMVILVVYFSEMTMAYINNLKKEGKYILDNFRGYFGL